MSGPESKIEDAGSKYAEKLGIMQRKYKTPGQVNAPDRIHLYKGQVFFIEYKAPGKPARLGQVREHNKLREQGFRVHVVDNVDDAKRIIDAEFKHANA